MNVKRKRARDEDELEVEAMRNDARE